MCSGGRNPKTGSYESPRNRYDAFTKMQERITREETEKYGIPRTTPFESDKKYFRRVGQYRQKQVDKLSDERNALMAQQQAESQRLQVQMLEQEKAQYKKAAGLREQQAERVSGIRSRGQSVVSSLAILGQNQQTAPTASQTAKTTRRGAGRTKAAVVRGSAQGGGINLSI